MLPPVNTRPSNAAARQRIVDVLVRGELDAGRFAE